MTTKNVEGVVVRLNERQVNTRNGAMMSYSILMQEGNEENWYGFAFKRPSVTPNQQIKFSANTRDWTNREGVKQTSWDGDGDTIETIKTPVPATATLLKKAVVNVDNRQRSIVLQTAFKVSPGIVQFAIDNNFITMPTKKADKFDAYKDLIAKTALELADRFINPPLNFVVSAPVAEDVTVDNEYVDEGQVV